MLWFKSEQEETIDEVLFAPQGLDTSPLPGKITFLILQVPAEMLFQKCL